jgi:hypothetical protein
MKNMGATHKGGRIARRAAFGQASLTKKSRPEPRENDVYARTVRGGEAVTGLLSD